MFAWEYGSICRNYREEAFREVLSFLFRIRKTHLRGIRYRCRYARLLSMRNKAAYPLRILKNQREIHEYEDQVRSNNQAPRALILNHLS